MVANMLSAIILGFRLREPAPGADVSRERAARSLSSLVGACVQGLVADAILVGPAGQSLERVADEAGCDFVETDNPADGVKVALRAARRPQILLLAAGFAVDQAFLEEVGDLYAFGAAPSARVLRAEPNTFVTRLAPRLAEAAGLIGSKADLIAIAAPDVSTFARKLRAADLKCRARSAM